MDRRTDAQRQLYVSLFVVVVALRVSPAAPLELMNGGHHLGAVVAVVEAAEAAEASASLIVIWPGRFESLGQPRPIVSGGERALNCNCKSANVNVNPNVSDLFPALLASAWLWSVGGRRRQVEGQGGLQLNCRDCICRVRRPTNVGPPSASAQTSLDAPRDQNDISSLAAPVINLRASFGKQRDLLAGQQMPGNSQRGHQDVWERPEWQQDINLAAKEGNSFAVSREFIHSKFT